MKGPEEINNKGETSIREGGVSALLHSEMGYRYGINILRGVRNHENKSSAGEESLGLGQKTIIQLNGVGRLLVDAYQRKELSGYNPVREQTLYILFLREPLVNDGCLSPPQRSRQHM